MVALGFEDLDVDLQRSVFGAFSILAIILLLSLVKWVHYAFITLCVLGVGYMAYSLFLKPKLKNKSKGK